MTLSQNTTWFGAFMVASLGLAMPLHAMGAAIPGAELNKADKLSPQP
jgi:hypothetical protein